MALRLRRPQADRARRADHLSDGEGAALDQRGGRFNRAWIMLVLVLGVAIVALLVMERSAGPPVPTLPAPPLQGEPDIYMESPVISQYRPGGTLEYRLVAEEARHFQRDALTRLTEPHLTLFQRDSPPWNMSASKGTLRRPVAAEESVSLHGDVTLEHTEADGGFLRLVTQTLHLYPRRQYAETDQDVMIESLFGRTTATGLEGDLELSMLELFSGTDKRVKTVLQPEHFK